jgi:nucleoside-diphosphate-sugar epimerase
MRILVLGGTGFIGSALVARLSSDGHECVTVSRGRNAGAKHIRLDIAKAVRPVDWFSALGGIDAVINAAGALQDSAGQSPEGGE